MASPWTADELVQRTMDAIERLDSRMDNLSVLRLVHRHVKGLEAAVRQCEREVGPIELPVEDTKLFSAANAQRAAHLIERKKAEVEARKAQPDPSLMGPDVIEVVA